MGNKNSNIKNSLIQSIIIPLFIVVLLIISGNTQAVSVVFSDFEPSYAEGKPVNFTISITIIDPDKYSPIIINLGVTGAARFNESFELDGTRISGDPINNIIPASTNGPDPFGNGYGYEGVAVTYQYNVSIITTSLPTGNYTAVVSLNTGKTGMNPPFDSAPANFMITSLHDSKGV